MIIKNMTDAELSPVALIEKQSFSRPWSRESLRESLLSPANRFYVCEISGEIVGYIGLSIACDEGYILNVAVAPEHRGKGVGRALLSFVIEKHARELSFITLEVRPSNTAAVSLYRGFGFEKVGERRDYYRDPTENAALFTKFF